ncbi:MAG: hypothetical protein ACUVS7_15415 [Bryobacteraceae bacterium]
MNSDVLSIAGGLCAFLGLTAVVTLRARKKMTEQWQGSVTGLKRLADKSDEGTGREMIRLSYRRDDGKAGSFDLDEGTFNARFAGVKPGDRLMKRAGTGLPELG